MRTSTAFTVLLALMVSGCAGGEAVAPLTAAADAGPPAEDDGGGSAKPADDAGAPAVLTEAGKLGEPPDGGWTEFNLPRVSDPVSSTFTRADHGMCGGWPLCPADVVGLRPNGIWLQNHLCDGMTDNIGRKAWCGPCIRRPSCTGFVGRCIAPIMGASPTIGLSGNCLPTGHQTTEPPFEGYTICTFVATPFDSFMSEPYGVMVCGDTWMPSP